MKRLLCLANSRKLSGRCVAGKEIIHGRPQGWIRPVSARMNQEINEEERRFENGESAQVLDLIDIPFLHAVTQAYQSENWLIHPDFYWIRAGRANWTGIPRLLDEPAPLWSNGQSSFSGLNNRIAIEHANRLHSSLRLVRVDYFSLRIHRPGEDFGNPRL